MEESLQHIDTIYRKLQLLLKKYESLQKDDAKDRAMIISQEEKIKKLQQEHEQLQQENLVLKAALQSMDEKDKKNLEQKINSYIRSLDKTISLLSQ